MKKITTLLFLVLSTVLFSQSTITVFNNGGQQFYVILNGIKQNSVAQTNVSVASIANGSYSMKLIFADGKTKDIDKNFFIEESSFITTRVLFKKGKGKLQLIGMEPAKNQAPAQNVVVYRPNDTVIFSDATVTSQTTTQQEGNVANHNNTSNGDVGANVNTNVSNPSSTEQIGSNTSVTTTTTTNDPSQNGENVGININVTDPTLNNGQGGMNVSINMNGTDNGNNSTTQQTTTVTTTTTSSASTINTGTVNTNVSTNGNNSTNTGVVTNSNQTTSNSNSSNQAVQCLSFLQDENKLIAELKTMTFEADRMEIVKEEVLSSCLYSYQAYKVIEIFTFEADRLELSKYLYLRLIDKDKGNSFFPLFTFDASKMEFRKFMGTVK